MLLVMQPKLEKKKEWKNGEFKEKLKIAKEMLKKKMSIDMICEITKLTKEEIEKIK